MQPHFTINWLAVGASVLASFALGNVWYGAIFRNAWCRAMGLGQGNKPSGAEIAKGSVLNVFATFLMAFVLLHSANVWRPSVWVPGQTDDAPYVYGFFAGFFTWLGFVMPTLLNGVAFERKPWKVFFINAVFQFISLQAMGMILSCWR
ncbi:MAG TPA: DUF1761 domain-containing protein [Planctomycetota bacterium]|nr:DUF1761 domain-containing protein [Planctomycetota bacterium]